MNHRLTLTSIKQRLLILSLTLIAVVSINPATVAQAQVIELPVGSQGQANANIARPSKGMMEQDVIARFGQPLATTAPIGNPPITRWEYAEFYVFFEYNHVIHSVLKK